GHHEFKLGGELLLPVNSLYWANSTYGVLTADLGPVPPNIQDLFPVWNDPTTWNIAALSPITRRYAQSVGTFDVYCGQSPSCTRKKPQYGIWVQDNWRVGSDLTVNLGIRWDFAVDGLAQDIVLLPIRPQHTEQRWKDFGPRLGFAYALPDKKTVVRGGTGLYYTGIVDHNQQFSINLVAVVPSLANDGRPNFASDPFNISGGGHVPTYQEVLAGKRDIISQPLDPSAKTPRSYQTSIGLQRQIGETMSVQADYVL